MFSTVDVYYYIIGIMCFSLLLTIIKQSKLQHKEKYDIHRWDINEAYNICNAHIHARSIKLNSCIFCIIMIYILLTVRNDDHFLNYMYCVLRRCTMLSIACKTQKTIIFSKIL